jgi:hypothetical protein
LFEIAEQFGQRFGEEAPAASDAGLTPEQEAQKAQRSEQAGCAATIVRLIAADQTLPLELRARAFYLAGNLEFLRGEYRAAVAAYDAALKLIPGFEGDAGDSVGRDAAYNRSIALRRLEDEQKDAGSDGGEPDGGDQPDAGEDSGPPDGGNQPDSGDQDQQDQKPDAGDEQDKPQEDQPDGGQQPPEQKPEQEQPPQQQPPQQQPQQNQDDRLLDQLEQAPLLQHQPARRRGRVLPSGDK